MFRNQVPVSFSMKNKNDNILRQILLKNQMKNNLFCTVITKIYLKGGQILFRVKWGQTLFREEKK